MAVLAVATRAAFANQETDEHHYRDPNSPIFAKREAQSWEQADQFEQSRAGADRFFATVFLGSGLLFLAMLFASTAMAGEIIHGLYRLDDYWRPA